MMASVTARFGLMNRVDAACAAHGQHVVEEMLRVSVGRDLGANGNGGGLESPPHRMAPAVEFLVWYSRLEARALDELKSGNLLASVKKSGGKGGGGGTPTQEQLHQVDTLLGLISGGAGNLCAAVDVLSALAEEGAVDCLDAEAVVRRVKELGGGPGKN